MHIVDKVFSCLGSTSARILATSDVGGEVYNCSNTRGSGSQLLTDFLSGPINFLLAKIILHHTHLTMISEVAFVYAIEQGGLN